MQILQYVCMRTLSVHASTAPRLTGLGVANFLFAR